MNFKVAGIVTFCVLALATALVFTVGGPIKLPNTISVLPKNVEVRTYSQCVDNHGLITETALGFNSCSLKGYVYYEDGRPPVWTGLPTKTTNVNTSTSTNTNTSTSPTIPTLTEAYSCEAGEGTLTSELWIIDYQTPRLQSLNIASGEVNDWATYPTQGPNSENFIISPAGNHMAYIRRATDGSIDIIVAKTDGSDEQILANGYGCFDGPCDVSQSVGQGEFSADGNYYSFRDGYILKLYNVDTRAVTELPAVNRSYLSPSISPQGTYAYVATYHSTTMQIGNVDGTNWHLFNSYDPFSQTDVVFSPDEKYFAVATNNYDPYAKSMVSAITLYETESEEQVAQKIFHTYSHEMVGSVLWLSGKQFIFNAPGGNYKGCLTEGKINLGIFEAPAGRRLYQLRESNNSILFMNESNEIKRLNIITNHSETVFSRIDPPFALRGMKK